GISADSSDGHTASRLASGGLDRADILDSTDVPAPLIDRHSQTLTGRAERCSNQINVRIRPLFESGFQQVETATAAPVLRYGALDRAHLTKHLWQLAKRVGVSRVTMRAL